MYRLYGMYLAVLSARMEATVTARRDVGAGPKTLASRNGQWVRDRDYLRPYPLDSPPVATQRDRKTILLAKACGIYCPKCSWVREEPVG